MKTIRIDPGFVYVIDGEYKCATIEFTVNSLPPLPDGDHGPGPAFDDICEERQRILDAVMGRIRDCVFLERVVVKGDTEYWEFGT